MVSGSIFVTSTPSDGLGEEECRRLLASRTLGRVGLTSGGLPVILPVEYVYSDGVVMFRSEHRTNLRAAAEGDVLAFEVDDYDPTTGIGWSVLALGRATVLTTEQDVVLVPGFVSGDHDSSRNHFVRLHCELISGCWLSSPRS